MSIPEIKIKRRENAGGVWYDVTIGGVTIYGCQRKRGSGAKGDYDFIATPQRKYQQNGVDKWTKIVSLDRDLEDAVKDAIDADDSGEYQGDTETQLDPF